MAPSARSRVVLVRGCGIKPPPPSATLPSSGVGPPPPSGSYPFSPAAPLLAGAVPLALGVIDVGVVGGPTFEGVEEDA